MALARWQAAITDSAGNVIANANVEVRREIPGQPLATVYSDRDGTVALGNPFPADADGYAAFHAAGGAYRVRAYSGAFERIWRYVGIGLAQETDEVSGFPGIVLDWDDGTADADPGSGEIRADNADLSAATTLYVSKDNVAGSDISARLLDLGDPYKSALDAVYLTQDDASQTSWSVTAVEDAGDYVRISVQDHSGETSIPAGEQITMQIALSGVDGLPGDVLGPSGGVVTGQLAVFADATGKEITGGELSDSPATPARIASDSDIFAAADGRMIHAGQLQSASAPVTLIDAAVVEINWAAGINFTLEIAESRTLDAPSNGQPGTLRTVLVRGPDESPEDGRTLSFGANFGGAPPTLTDITASKWYLLTIMCIDVDHYIVSSVDGSPP